MTGIMRISDDLAVVKDAKKFVGVRRVKTVGDETTVRHYATFDIGNGKHEHQDITAEVYEELNKLVNIYDVLHGYEKEK